MQAITVMKLLTFLTLTWSGVKDSSFLFKLPAIEPISVSIPVAIITASILPLTTLVPE